MKVRRSLRRDGPVDKARIPVEGICESDHGPRPARLMNKVNIEVLKIRVLEEETFKKGGDHEIDIDRFGVEVGEVRRGSCPPGRVAPIGERNVDDEKSK